MRAGFADPEQRTWLSARADPKRQAPAKPRSADPLKALAAQLGLAASPLAPLTRAIRVLKLLDHVCFYYFRQ